MRKSKYRFLKKLTTVKNWFLGEWDQWPETSKTVDKSVTQAIQHGLLLYASVHFYKDDILLFVL
jgi:hypothetical protein